MTRTELLSYHEKVCAQARELMKSKSADYASGDDPFRNFRGASVLGLNPIIGIALRLQDKLSRLSTFASRGELAVKTESVDDILLDVVNYAVLAGGLIQEGRPKLDTDTNVKPDSKQ